MRPFDLTSQIERLTASGIGRIQGISDDVYRNIWPKTVEMPSKLEDRFDRALIVDAFPLYPLHTAFDRGSRRVTRPVRLLPLPRTDKPTSAWFEHEDAVAPLAVRTHVHLLRYVIFWQAGERWKGSSPNAMRSRFDPDECGLRVNEGLHLPLQEEDLVRKRVIPLADIMYGHGEVYRVEWPETAKAPFFNTGFGMFVDLDGVPSRAREVIPVSTEDQDFFLKE
jgi:hypothetical protein